MKISPHRYRLKMIDVLNVAALKKEVDPGKFEKLFTHEQERMYGKLLMCIREHQRALECISIVQSAFSTALFIQIMLNILLLSISGVTLTKLVLVVGVDNDTAVECLPALMSVMVMLAKYLNGVLHTKKIKEVCEMIKTDTERLLDLPEYDVLHMHALEGRKFLEQFLGALIVLVIVYLTLPTVLIINNIVHNVTQNRYTLYPGTYYFVDDEDVYYTQIVHSYLASLMIVYILYSLDTLYITFTQHACAMFAVVGYRLKTIHVLNVAALKKEVDPGKFEKLLIHKQERMYEKLLLCIREHQRALKCISIVQSVFSTALFIQIMLNILLLSISGVTALLRLAERRLTDAARLITWMMGDHLHLFFLYFPGQRMLDYSKQVYFDALECQWHKCFKKTQVVYQILVMRSLFPFKFTALKITPLNMEAFLSVTQTAVSYFTVLSSTL